MVRGGESNSHKRIKNIIETYLNEKYGPSLSEYMDDGDRTDITSYNIEGVKIRLEIIWSPNLFWYDMCNILASNAKIKVVVCNPKILSNNRYNRFFKRRILSEHEKGYALLDLFDGTKILDGNIDYLNNLLYKINEKIDIEKNKITEYITKNQILFQKTIDVSLENVIKYNQKFETDKLTNEIEKIIMITKEKIQDWDVQSVKYATKNIFIQLYKYSENNGFCELFLIYLDLFDYAYKERKYILLYMIEELFNIIMMSWIKEYNIEKGEKACKLLLRLGVKYLDLDITISTTCYEALDTWSADFFEPEIFSKQILFGSAILEKATKEQNLERFFREVIFDIKQNDDLSWDAGTFTYLLDAIKYAENEQAKYNLDISEFKEKYLVPSIQEKIDININISDFLMENIQEEVEDNKFIIDLIKQLIESYKIIRPNIAVEIKKIIQDTNNDEIIKYFNRIINSDDYLSSIYK